MIKIELFVFLIFLLAGTDGFKNLHFKENIETSPSNLYTSIGCVVDPQFFYNGTVTSPMYPYNYPPNDQCYYYLNAEPGKVLKISFSHFDLESCCDYVTIHDGLKPDSPTLVQIGGPGSTVTTPGTYYSTTRTAVVVFRSNPTIQKTGFSMEYTSVDTASPCNRDILVVMNGMAGVGSQSNFQKQINYIANQLTPTWTVALDKVRVMLHLQVSEYRAEVWSATDEPTNAIVTQKVLGMGDDVRNVTQNTKQNLKSLFQYAHGDILNTDAFGERDGIEKVAIIFVAANPNDDQDYYGSLDWAHKMRTEQDAKVILVGMGNNLDQSKLSKLAYASGFAFFSSSYDNLNSLTPKINNAICAGINSQCGP